MPKGYKGQITWSEIDNRSFLRLAHGTLLGLMHRREGKSAMVLAKKLLAWCPMELQEGLTYERDDEKRGSYAWRSTRFVEGITDDLSKQIIRKVRNRNGAEAFPWERVSTCIAKQGSR